MKFGRLTEDDFPLREIGTLIYARTQSSPVLTAATPEMASQIVGTLNTRATEERPDIDNRNWLVIQ